MVDTETLPQSLGAAFAVLNAKAADRSPEAELRRWFDLHTALVGAHRLSAAQGAWRYSCLYDLVARVGRAYAPRPLPKPYRKLPLRECYANATRMALYTPGLTYVEGYGYTEAGFPAAHAWCVDDDHNVYDFTWRWTARAGATHFRPERGALIGVPIPTPLLAAVLAKREYYSVLDDWEHDFPALHREWDPQRLIEHYRALPDRGAARRTRAETRAERANDAQ